MVYHSEPQDTSKVRFVEFAFGSQFSESDLPAERDFRGDIIFVNSLEARSIQLVSTYISMWLDNSSAVNEPLGEDTSKDPVKGHTAQD